MLEIRKKYINSWIWIGCSGGSRIFERGGRPLSLNGILSFCKVFAKNCMKIKNIGPGVPRAPGIRQCVARTQSPLPQDPAKTLQTDSPRVDEIETYAYMRVTEPNITAHICAWVFVCVFKVLTFSWLRRLSGRTPRVPSLRHRTGERNYPASGSPPFYNIAA